MSGHGILGVNESLSKSLVLRLLWNGLHTFSWGFEKRGYLLDCSKSRYNHEGCVTRDCAVNSFPHVGYSRFCEYVTPAKGNSFAVQSLVSGLVMPRRSLLISIGAPPGTLRRLVPHSCIRIWGSEKKHGLFPQPGLLSIYLPGPVDSSKSFFVRHGS